MKNTIVNPTKENKGCIRTYEEFIILSNMSLKLGGFKHEPNPKNGILHESFQVVNHLSKSDRYCIVSFLEYDSTPINHRRNSTICQNLFLDGYHYAEDKSKRKAIAKKYEQYPKIYKFDCFLGTKSIASSLFKQGMEFYKLKNINQ